MGTVLLSLPILAIVSRDDLRIWAVPPALGILLLPFRGPVRRFGVGLLVSTFTIPGGVLLFGLVGFTV